MPVAIRIENLWKQYRIGAQQASITFADAWSGFGRRLWRGLRKGAGDSGRELNSIWALREVSLDIEKGDIVGVIGRNGAGKSTLLKVLSRITEPTRGSVELRGRVGSLLEVGTGFHPELAGRENIFLSGAILGMKRREIARKFDEIVAFSEIEKFIDTPVKHYSTGMYTRLAFAVAAHLEPEILLVDEILAVGDAVFQRKCLGKMGDAVNQGKTVLLVSHNMVAIESLCSKVLWIESGEVRHYGPCKDVVGEYLAAGAALAAERSWPEPAAAPGNEEVRLARICVRPARPTDARITIRTSLEIEVEYEVLAPSLLFNLSLTLYSEMEVPIFNTLSTSDPEWRARAHARGRYRSLCVIPGDMLNDGIHRLWIYMVKDRARVIALLPDALVFDVSDDPSLRDGWYGKFLGAVRPLLEWRTFRLE